MPNASIFAQYAQPVKSVADYMAERDQQEGNALKLAAARMDMQKAQQADADTQVIRGLARQHGGDTNALVKALYGGGYLTQAQALDKSVRDGLKDTAETDLKRQQALEAAGKNTDAAFTRYKKLLDYVQTPDQARLWVQAQHEDPVLSPLVSKVMPIDQAIASVPNDPQQFAQWRSQQSQGMEAYAAKIAPKPKEVRLGDRVVTVDENPMSPTFGKEILSQVIGQSPDNKATVAATLRGQNLVDARSRESAAATRDVAAATREAAATTYDPERGFLINRATGLARPAATIDGKPLGPKDKPLPEGAQKQLIGTRNLQDAVDGYQKVLEKWGNHKMLSPDARAEMGNAYNNMMLQAKEAYNLGVLNGPDYDILQSVVKDPTKWTSIATSNSAMSGQAAELKRIAASIERTALEAHGKQYVPRGDTSTSPPKPGSVVDFGSLK